MISKTKVKNFNRINLSKETLTDEHQIRASKSILFSHYENLKTWRKEQKEKKFLDLNIDKRKASKEKAEAELLALENRTRKKLGLSTFDTYESFLQREENSLEPDVDEEVLIEAAQVLSDFIQKSYKPVISMNKAS